MASKRIAQIGGLSTTGVTRGLLLETSKSHPDMVLATVTGVDGKRHAAMLLDTVAIDALIDALVDAKGMVQA